MTAHNLIAVIEHAVLPKTARFDYKGEALPCDTK